MFCVFGYGFGEGGEGKAPGAISRRFLRRQGLARVFFERRRMWSEKGKRKKRRLGVSISGMLQLLKQNYDHGSYGLSAYHL